MVEMAAGGEAAVLPGLETMGGEEEHVRRRFHRHELGDGQCSSAVAMRIKAPLHLVWSIVRRFDEPQIFQPFVRRCAIRGSVSVAVGCVREVDFKSGFPAKSSVERLDILDDREHDLRIRFVGGDHRLKNYSSVLTANAEVVDGQPATLVTESFVVDVPEGNTADETCHLVEFLIGCNLRSLAVVSQRLLALHPPPAAQ